MGRPEFARKIAARCGVSAADVEAVLATLLEMAREQGFDQVLRFGQDDDGTDDEPTEVVFIDSDAPRGNTAPAGHAAGSHSLAYVPTEREVQTLIADARRHPLGLDFLLSGDLGAVAITFRTHAFTVDAARQYLRDHGEPAGSSTR